MTPRFHLALVLLAAPQLLWGFGTPDWAKPHMAKPSPKGDFLAPEDTWAIVYGEVSIGLSPQKRFTEHWKLLLENIGKNPETLVFSFAYDAGQDELEEIEMHVQRRFWHKIPVSRKAATATSSRATSALFVAAEQVEPGRRIAVELSLQDAHGFLPWRAFHLPLSYPAAQLRVGLEDHAVSAGAKIVFRAPPGCGIEARQLTEATWEFLGLPSAQALEKDEHAFQTAWDQRRPYLLATLQGSAGESFAAFARYYANAWEQAQAQADTAEVRKLAEALVAGKSDWLSKVRALCEFVQNDVSYDASTLKSVENWLPLAPGETLRSQRADCKGKVALLQSLLAAVGVKSVPLLLRVEDQYFSWGELPGTAFFNHVALAIEPPPNHAPLPAMLTQGPLRGFVLFDPTAETPALGNALPGYEGLPALAAGAFPEPVFEVATTQPSLARLVFFVRYHVSASGALQVTLEVADNGLSPTISQLLGTPNPSQQAEIVRQALQPYLPGAKLTALRIAKPAEAPSGDCELHAEIEATQALTPLGSDFTLPGPFALLGALANLPNLPPPAPRNAPKPAGSKGSSCVTGNGTGRAWSVEARAEVRLEGGWLWELPEPNETRWPWLSFSESWQRNPAGTYSGVLLLSGPRGVWPAEQLAQRLKSHALVWGRLTRPLVLSRQAKR